MHLIVATTGAHRAPDLPLTAAVAMWPSSGCRFGSRSWMCQYHRSRRKSWRLVLVRSSATLVQASGDSTGGRAHVEQIVDVPAPQILEQNVEVIKVIPQEPCQRLRFFTFQSVWEGGCRPSLSMSMPLNKEIAQLDLFRGMILACPLSILRP